MIGRLQALAMEKAEEYAGRPGTVAVAITGSVARGTTWAGSDVDLWVFADAPTPFEDGLVDGIYWEADIVPAAQLEVPGDPDGWLWPPELGEHADRILEVLWGCRVAYDPTGRLTLLKQAVDRRARDLLWLRRRADLFLAYGRGCLAALRYAPPLWAIIAAREVARRAAQQEYVVVFPPYYFGQIFEAKHQPGVMAYGSRVIWDLLQETCDELGRNGFRKIVLVNGHGGNNNFLHYFVQAQLERPRPYAVFLYEAMPNEETDKRIAALRKTPMDMHAGETETSTMMAIRPDLAHPERAGMQSGADQNRLAALSDAYTGIWWYARFPNHYAGDGSPANRELGEVLLTAEVEPLVRLLRAVKKDEATLKLQERFFGEAAAPLATPQ